MELNSFQTHQLTRRMPHVELSYETIPHKKVSPEYNVCMAIPVGKKCYLWYTFYQTENGNENVCFILDLNREKKPFKATIVERGIDNKLAKGTLLYGTVFEEIINEKTVEVFIIDDVLHYEGNTTRGLQYDTRLGILSTYMSQYGSKIIGERICVALPMIWPIKKDEEYECVYELPEKWAKYPEYITHHVQYRCLKQAAPYYNIIPTRKAFTVSTPTPISNKTPELVPDYGNIVRFDYSKQIYRQTATFIITADIQFDVYHLFAYGRNKQKAYCGIAGVPNYKTSVYLNGIFRKIRENQNLDAIEESDDESDFQNPAEDKWVDLHKQVQMECTFNSKFKKWVPTKLLTGWNKIVHISQL